MLVLAVGLCCGSAGCCLLCSGCGIAAGAGGMFGWALGLSIGMLVLGAGIDCLTVSGAVIAVIN